MHQQHKKKYKMCVFIPVIRRVYKNERHYFQLFLLVCHHF